MEIILASKSKRRIEMMEELGFPFVFIDSNTKEETTYKNKEELVMNLAKNKALAVLSSHENDLILGFDTLVFLNNEPIGKPHSKEECIEMIKKLSGKTHEVITGGYLYTKDYQESFYRNTYVTFSNINEDEIIKYAETNEPYDKAGAYALQGYMGRFIEKIEGDIFTVIGMPKAYVYSLLKRYYK